MRADKKEEISEDNILFGVTLSILVPADRQQISFSTHTHTNVCYFDTCLFLKYAVGSRRAILILVPMSDSF